MKVKGFKKGDKTKVGEFTGFLQSVHCFSMRKRRKALSEASVWMKGVSDRRERTAGEKMLVKILMNWGIGRSVPR